MTIASPITLASIPSLLLAAAASAQPTIDPHKIAGGGGTSVGSTFTLSGTIGQCDAGPVLSAGSITLTGGFWAAAGPAAPQCGSADFNCDGDIGTDADIESFFACLSGSCPPLPCNNNADFNADGDIGTDADIEAFFRVLGGGAC
jgi:hypothetical protein